MAVTPENPLPPNNPPPEPPPERRRGSLPSLDSTAAVLIAESWLSDPRPVTP